MRELNEYLIESEVNEGLPVYVGPIVKAGSGWIPPLNPAMATSVFKATMMKIGAALTSPVGIATICLVLLIYPMFKGINRAIVSTKFNKINKKLNGDSELDKLAMNMDKADFKFMEESFKKLSEDKEFQVLLKQEEPEVKEIILHLNRVLGDDDYIKYLKISKKYVQSNPKVIQGFKDF